jgi:hypothetical protein
VLLLSSFVSSWALMRVKQEVSYTQRIQRWSFCFVAGSVTKIHYVFSLLCRLFRLDRLLVHGSQDTTTATDFISRCPSRTSIYLTAFSFVTTYQTATLHVPLNDIFPLSAILSRFRTSSQGFISFSRPDGQRNPVPSLPRQLIYCS